MAAPASSLLGTLPMPRTRLIGRESERASARAYLLDESVPLLTLTGPGGVGKTRLALAIATDVHDAFADGVRFVDLSPIRDPTLVLSAVAQATGIRETGDRPLLDVLQHALRSKQVLLLIDNCEQVLDAAPNIAALLTHCPALQVLATSRAPLRIHGEQELTVPPLALARRDVPTAELAQVEAVALFLQRAHAINRTFAPTAAEVQVIAEICRRLDGLPLAIELAAARTKVLSPPALLAKLAQRLRLLTGGARDLPIRQRTMRDTIAWSYDLLTPEEQSLFRCLAIFVGSFTLEAAEAVCMAGPDPVCDVLDGITSLTDKSLLRRDTGVDDESRFFMLETPRAFGLEQLDASGEEVARRDFHLAWFLVFIERTCPAILVHRTASELDQLELEHDNLRAALAWSLERGDARAALRLSGALRDFWYMRGHISEGRRWLEASLAIGADAPTAHRARALLGLGEFANDLGDLDRGTAALQESLALYRALGDRLGTSHALYLLGCQAADQGHYATAEPLMIEARSHAEAVGDRFCSNASIYQLGVIAQGQGDLDLALARYEESQRRARAEDDYFNIANTLWYQGLVQCKWGRFALAADALEEALAMERALGDLEGAAPFFANFGVLALAAGLPDVAARLLGTAAGAVDRRGMAFGLPERVDYDRALTEARSQLEEITFGVAWDAGWMRTILESVADIEEVLAAARTQPTAAKLPTLTEGTGLTTREIEVLRLVAQGHSNRDIAAVLFISVPTVKRHITNVLGKLGLPSRSAATAYAHTHGLL